MHTRKVFGQNDREKSVIPIVCSSLMKKMFKKRLVLILFLTSVLIYIVAVFWGIQAYEEWKKIELERYPTEVRPYVDFNPYFSSNQGKFMILLGAIMGFAWLITVVVLDRFQAKKLGMD